LFEALDEIHINGVPSGLSTFIIANKTKLNSDACIDEEQFTGGLGGRISRECPPDQI
jgi:hypothetical protein